MQPPAAWSADASSTSLGFSITAVCFFPVQQLIGCGFTFNASNVDYAIWINNDSAKFQPQFDNVVASVAAAPIPATLPLLAAALGGLSFVG